MSAVDVGAFVDGLGISSPATLPVSGTASYSGTASGLYAGQYGTDVAGATAGAIEFRKYSGTFRAVADFGSDTVSGSVSEIFVDGVITAPDGTLDGAYGSVPTRLVFGATVIPTPLLARMEEQRLPPVVPRLA